MIMSLDGTDISELLQNPESTRLQERPFYFYARNGEPEAVRLGKWKLHIKKSIGWDAGKQGVFPVSLYNLHEDIGEQNNVADQYPDIVRQLTELISEFDEEYSLILVAGCLMLASCKGPKPGPGEEAVMLEKVSFQEVTINDNFWRPKIEINRVASIRHALQQASQSIEYFDIAAGKSEAEHKGNMASDSDVYKIIQGAAYALYHTPDPELEAMVDSVIDRIVAAQQAGRISF